MAKNLLSRRNFLQVTAIVAAGPALRGAAWTQSNLDGASTIRSSELAADSEYWEKVAAEYFIDRSITNLENAYWGAMARPVEAAYLECSRFVNRMNVAYVRDAIASQPYSKDLAAVRAQIAQQLGCAAEEIAPTRSGTEALQNLIVNYNRLSPGDSILYADLDFDAMQFAMDYLADRRSAKVVRFTIPEPALRENILECYVRVLRTTVRPKLLLLTHLSHRTGLMMPVAEIARMARQHGVDVILDAAQSWGQVDFRIADLGVDFAGFSLHKWMGAPLGTGFLYIKASRLGDIDPHFENRDWPAEDIRARVLTGTTNFASVLSVPAALDFHTRMGAARKESRLRFLRDYWVNRVQEFKDIEVLTPNDPTLHAGVTSFRLNGKPATWVQQRLLNKYGILTAARKGITKGDAVRVTPALFTRESDLDRLVVALKEMAVMV